jgi:hypothetical protein
MRQMQALNPVLACLEVLLLWDLVEGQIIHWNLTNQQET